MIKMARTFFDKRKIKKTNSPKKVIFHCADTDDTNDPNHSHYNLGRDDINEWHKKKGWLGIGYHFVIKRNGEISVGRPVDMPGAHTRGQNKSSIGVCYMGRRSPSEEQKDAFKSLYKSIRDRYGLEAQDWYCHNQFARKDCPGFSVNVLRSLLL